ncbi:hypothetical protein, partial [Streptomyces sp. NPDC002690]
IPAFLAMVMMPFTYSITNGIGIGFTSPSPTPSPTPSARPTPHVVALPAYHRPRRQVHDSGTSLVTLSLMITAPAVFAVAVLRPRSSR